MKEFFVSQNLKEPPEGATLIDEVIKKLVTTDVQIAMRAGCHFEVSLVHTKEGITMSLRSKEKVSILKTPDGYPVSVIIKP